MFNVKKANKERLARILKENPEIAEDTLSSNHSNLSLITTISFILKTLKLLINISSFSYFIGMSVLLMCKVVHHYEVEGGYQVNEDNKDDRFITNFDI